MRDKPISIVMTVDDVYSIPFLVAVQSILDTHDIDDFSIYVLSRQTAFAAARTQRFLEQRQVKYQIVEAAMLDIVIARSPYVYSASASSAHFMRLFVGDVFPQLQKVIYLDCDIMVRKPLHGLWAQNLDEAIVGAVQCPAFMAAEEADFRAAYGGKYFNSGVLLIDLERWRRDKITERVIAWSAVFAKAEAFNMQGFWRAFQDQSPMNKVLASRWKSLSPTWNFTWVTKIEYAPGYNLRLEELEAIEADPAIYHFFGPMKPWTSPNYNNFTIEYCHIERIVRNDLESTAAEKSETLKPIELDAALISARREFDRGMFLRLIFKLVNRRQPVTFLHFGNFDREFTLTLAAFAKSPNCAGTIIESSHENLRLFRDEMGGQPAVRSLEFSFAQHEFGQVFITEVELMSLVMHEGDRSGPFQLTDLYRSFSYGADLVVLDQELFSALGTALVFHTDPPSVILAIAMNLPHWLLCDRARVLKQFGYVVVRAGGLLAAVQSSQISDRDLGDLLHSNAGNVEAF